jgi:2-polyprenyl-6-hydroxyphenyl methylase/3-demethylubiquinone-9 3-methyltransferase
MEGLKSMADSRDQQFINYTLTTQLDSDKLSAFTQYHDTIKREMERRGTWRENLRFLDVGCGIGLYSEFWASKGFQVVGIDLHGPTLAVARQRAAEKRAPVEYVLAAADDMPFADASFDVVFAHALLEHVPEWERSLGDFTRLLAPGGLLWIQTTNVICPYQREFRWLPVYSWWPRPIKRIVEALARGPLPALANYTSFPAINWFSYFTLRRSLERRGLLVSDRFDCMNPQRVSRLKWLVRRLAISSDIGRWISYLSIEALVVLATRPFESKSIAR